MRVLLANPRGFCAGVDRAIEIVEIALRRFGAPVYVRHEIVHNQHVVEGLRKKGAVFVEDPTDAPPGSLLVFSAHGVSPAVREAASRHGLRCIDATCPLVTKVHVEAERFSRRSGEIVLIGHAGHVEVEGTMGHAPDRIRLVESVADVEKLEVEDPSRLAVLTQTTLSLDDTREIIEALRRRFPDVRMPRKDDICYATQNRQNAVKAVARDADLVLVVGAPESSNSNRLVEAAEKQGVSSHLVQTARDIRPEWLEGVECVGVAAGASAPEILVEEVVERLRHLSGDADRVRVDTLPAAEEEVVFQLPAELRTEC
jgi:4-hydroxy-3-methylbut-2-enyl diphosphate reductase